MYINAILNSLQIRKYCQAIMDDLLLFTPSKRVHMDKLEVKKERFENISKEMSTV